jgi:hypothetical protein
MRHLPECQNDELKLPWKTLACSKIYHLRGNAKHQYVFIECKLVPKTVWKIHLLDVRHTAVNNLSFNDNRHIRASL